MSAPAIGVYTESGLGGAPPSINQTAGSNDSAVRIPFGTGTSPASSTDSSGATGYFLCRILFAGSWASALGNDTGILANPVTCVTPENGKTAALGPFWTQVPTGSNPGPGTAVDIWCTNAPAASQAAGTYQLSVACVNGP